MNKRVVLLEQLATQVANLDRLAAMHPGTAEGALIESSRILFASYLDHFLEEGEVLVGEMPWWRTFSGRE